VRRPATPVPELALRILENAPRPTTATSESSTKGSESRMHGGFKDPTYGPPGLAAPISLIPQSEGRHRYFNYEGDWKNGKMDGYGHYRFADGGTYTGVMRNDWPEGSGKAVYTDGGVYDGNWKVSRVKESSHSIFSVV
jgi:hypothetical protein